MKKFKNAPVYGCNNPGDNSGEYVKATEAGALQEVHTEIECISGGTMMSYFGMKDRFLDGDKDEKVASEQAADSVSVPTNDNDIEGIKNYLGWHMYKAGLSSTAFHYLDILWCRRR